MHLETFDRFAHTNRADERRLTRPLPPSIADRIRCLLEAGRIENAAGCCRQLFFTSEDALKALPLFRRQMRRRLKIRFMFNASYIGKERPAFITVAIHIADAHNFVRLRLPCLHNVFLSLSGSDARHDALINAVLVEGINRVGVQAG